jgi:hypothetical protein
MSFPRPIIPMGGMNPNLIPMNPGAGFHGSMPMGTGILIKNNYLLIIF